MYVTFASQMKSIDNRAIEKYRIPGIVLMENAAIKSVQVIENFIGIFGKTALVFCGSGNNGGDGYAISRHLINLGARVKVAVLGEAKTIDAKTNFEAAKAAGIEFLYDTDKIKVCAGECDFIIDALYGVGFYGKLKDSAKKFIEIINGSKKTVFSIDLPSGINADSGKLTDICVKADYTVTFTAYKLAHLLFPAAEFCGRVIVCDISIPKSVVKEENIDCYTIDRQNIKNLLPIRKKNTHKGDYGKVFIVAGSVGMSGAAYIASNACLKSGAGLVTVGVPECINQIIEQKTTEVISIALPSDKRCLTYDAVTEILNKTEKCDALLFGPGLSDNCSIFRILDSIIDKISMPLVLDADGINALSKDLSVLKKAKCPIIITPHNAEMGRLTGLTPSRVEEDKIAVALNFAMEHNITVILKGAHTVVADQNGRVYVNNQTGNPGMATAGSGDVLAGVVVSFLAQGLPPLDASTFAVYLHGLAGDFAAKQKGQASMVAGDITETLAEALKELENYSIFNDEIKGFVV